MELNLIRELGQFAFPEIGLPTGIFWNEDRSMFAIASTFGRPFWSCRKIYEKMLLRHRLTLYEAENLTRIGTFDIPRYSIKDVAFHPTQKTVAIATGDYDGGYLFEGDLLIWNFDENSYNSLLNRSREVTRCRFNNGGDTLYFVLKPANDEEDKSKLFTYATDSFTSGQLDLKALHEIGLQEAGFEIGLVKQNRDKIIEELKSFSSILEKEYEQRKLFWDVAWINENEIVATGESAVLEHWDSQGERKLHVSTSGVGVQLFPSTDKKNVYVNVFDNTYSIDMSKLPDNYVLGINLETGIQKELYRPDCTFLLSISLDNQFLVRDGGKTIKANRGVNTKDIIVNSDFCSTDYLDLGYYDCVNCYLRIDGQQHLYFLQGSPKNQYKNKWICRVDPRTRCVERLFPLDWDTKRNAHMYSYGGCYVSDNDGEALVLSSQFWNAAGFLKDAAVLARRDIKGGRLIWEKRFNSPVTSVAYMNDFSVIAFSLAEGKIGLLSSIDGKEINIQDVLIEGVPDVVSSLSCQGEMIVAGTVGGRLLVYKV